MTDAPGARISVAAAVLEGNESKYVLDCIEREWLSAGGHYSTRFELSFAEFCGTRRALTCSNGTAALHLALLAAGITAGDEVIVPSLTYIATANAVRYCGATPVFADSEPDTMTIDPDHAASLVTARTRAIIPVHLYGHVADMDPLTELASRHDLFVLEDAAEAHGATYRGRRAGSLAHAATFSFFGNKVITTGEGGMVTTDDEMLAAKMELLRGQGMDPQRRYWFPVIGYNYRLADVQAAIGLAQLERVDHLLAARQRVARWYDHYLHDLRELLILPTSREWASHIYWMYTVILADSTDVDRDALMNQLDANGIETRPVFHPVHILPPYADGTELPVAQRLGARGINLPTHARLSEQDVARVAAELGRALRGS